MAVHCRCGAAVSFAVITAAKSARLLGVLRNPRTVIHYVRGMLCLAVRSICMNTFLTTSTSVPWRDSFTDDSIGSDVRTGRTPAQPFRDFLFQLIYGRLTKRKKRAKYFRKFIQTKWKKYARTITSTDGRLRVIRPTSNGGLKPGQVKCKRNAKTTTVTDKAGK